MYNYLQLEQDRVIGFQTSPIPYQEGDVVDVCILEIPEPNGGLLGYTYLETPSPGVTVLGSDYLDYFEAPPVMFATEPSKTND